MPTDFPSLAQLVADAKRMPASMLPRPRAVPRAEDTGADAPRTIDLTPFEIRIPESATSLVDALDPYGS